MLFDNKLHITFMDDTENRLRQGSDHSHPLDLIPFQNEIERIYRGYRQCYSKNLFEDKPFTEDQKREIRDRFAKRFATPRQCYSKNLFEDKPFTEDQKREIRDRFAKRFVSPVIRKINDTKEASARTRAANAEKTYGEEAFLRHLYKCEYIASHLDHTSPMEHGSLTVHVKGVDRSFSHQLVRHRIASYSQQSQRYVDETDMHFIISPTIKNDTEIGPIVTDILQYIANGVHKIHAINNTRAEADRIENEDIRSVYPNALETEVVVTFNMRMWEHFFSERCCSRAQWHIREFANQVLRYLQTNVPYVFDDMGAKCTNLKMCPEKESCGRFPSANTVIAVYEKFKESTL